MPKRRKTFHRHFIKKMILLILFSSLLLGIYAIWAYQQSTSLISHGTELMVEGKTPEAIDSFTKANEIFPFNQTALRSLRGAQLVQQSIQDYGNVAEIDAEIENAELQTIPSENALKPIKLKKK